MDVDESRLTRLRADLDRLVRLDTELRVFGAAGVHGHGYRRAPTRDAASLDAAFGALLPAEVRAFLAHVHGGGAGPGYGLDVWAEPRASSPFPYGTAHARALIERGATERSPSLPLVDDDDDDSWPPGPGFVAIIIFASNFLSTDLFKAGYQNFSVWFVLSIFAFACGWLINKTLGYNHGGKVVFSVIVSAAFLSVFLISIMSEYFGMSEILVENLILYILRSITLGAMALFGMVVCELLIMQKDGNAAKLKLEEMTRLMNNAQREAQVIIDEARLKSEKMIYETQKSIDEILDRKNQVETRLKEFISTERELVKKYESEEE